MKWNSLKDGDRIEIGALQVDIAGHSRLRGSDRAIKNAKDIFRQQVQGIAQIRGAKPLRWAGDGGSFIFLTDRGTSFDHIVLSALQILNTLPAINDEIAILTDFDGSLSARISCGGLGAATYDRDPSQISSKFLNTFLKYEKKLGIENGVSVTGDLHRQLSTKLRDQFGQNKRVRPVGTVYIYRGRGSLRGIGMVGLWDPIGGGAIKDRLSTAREIWIQKTWFPEDPTIEDGLKNALDNEAKIHLLLCHPDSETLRIRSEGAGNKKLSETADWIEKALRRVSDVTDRKPKLRFTIGLYDYWPGCPVIWADEQIFMGFYFVGDSSPHWPWIEVAPQSRLAGILDDQWDQLEVKAIDLSTRHKLQSWLKGRGGKRRRP